MINFRAINLRALAVFALVTVGVMALFARETGGPDQTPLAWALSTAGLSAVVLAAGGVLLVVLLVVGQGSWGVQQAQRLVQQGQGGAALDRYNQIVAAHPTQADALVGRAELLLEQDQTRAALTDLNQAITSTPHVRNFADPLLVTAYLRRGRVRELLGDQAGAVDDWNQATAVAPGRPEPYLARGRLAAEQGHSYQAGGELQRAIQLTTAHLQQPRQDRAVGLSLRGQAYTLLGQPHNALTDLEAALALRPREWIIHVHLAETYLALGQRDAALASLSEALALYPSAAPLIRRWAAFQPLQEDSAFARLLSDAAHRSASEIRIK